MLWEPLHTRFQGHTTGRAAFTTLLRLLLPALLCQAALSLSAALWNHREDYTPRQGSHTLQGCCRIRREFFLQQHNTANTVICCTIANYLTIICCSTVLRKASWCHGVSLEYKLYHSTHLACHNTESTGVTDYIWPTATHLGDLVPRVCCCACWLTHELKCLPCFINADLTGGHLCSRFNHY